MCLTTRQNNIYLKLIKEEFSFGGFNFSPTIYTLLTHCMHEQGSEDDNKPTRTSSSHHLLLYRGLAFLITKSATFGNLCTRTCIHLEMGTVRS